MTETARTEQQGKTTATEVSQQSSQTQVREANKQETKGGGTVVDDTASTTSTLPTANVIQTPTSANSNGQGQQSPEYFIVHQTHDDMRRMAASKKYRNKRSGFGTLLRYVKLLLLILMVLVFFSVFANVYQTFAGDCEELNQEITELQATNDNLKNVTAELEASNAEIEVEITALTENVERLTQQIANLSDSNKELEQQIEDIEKLAEQLKEVLVDKDQSFDEFKEDVGAIIAGFNVEIQNLIGTIGSVSVVVQNLTDEVNRLSETVSGIEETYEQTVARNNRNFLNFRELIARSLSVRLGDLDSSPLISETEFELFLERMSDVYFEANRPSAEELKQGFSFEFENGESLDIDIDQVIDSIADQSETESPELFIPYGLSN